MSYVMPGDVNSPKAHWRLEYVLLDRGAGDCAYALGEWDGERRIGFRWNGTDEGPIGNPQSRGLPTWTMLDPALHDTVIAILPPEAQVRARRFFGTGVVFDTISVSEDRIAMFDVGRRLVAFVASNIIRETTGKPDLSDDHCRLLVERNRDLINEIVDPKFERGDYKEGNQGLRFMEISREEFTNIAKRLSTSVLDIASGFRWGG